MKLYPFSVLLLVLNLMICSSKDLEGKKMPSYKVHVSGCFVLPAHLKKAPCFKIHYKGEEAENNSQGIFSFMIENKSLSQIVPSLLFSKKENLRCDARNTVAAITPTDAKHQRYFVYENEEWKEKEAPKDVSSLENCCIIIMNPKLVKALEPSKAEVNKHIAFPALHLPNIILDPSFSTEEYEKASCKSLLYSRDASRAHRKAPHVVFEGTNPKGTAVHISRAY